MGTVSRIPAFEGPVSRVLHAQRRGDDEHFFQAIPFPGGQYHARHLRVDGKFGQPPADGGEGPFLARDILYCSQFRQQLVAIGDHPGQGRLHEWKILDFANPERLHAQDHGGQG